MKILAVLLLKWNYVKHNTFLANVFSCFSHICLYFFSAWPWTIFMWLSWHARIFGHPFQNVSCSYDLFNKLSLPS